MRDGSTRLLNSKNKLRRNMHAGELGNTDGVSKSPDGLKIPETIPDSQQDIKSYLYKYIN